MSAYHSMNPTPADYRAFDLPRKSDFPAALLAMAGHDLRQPLQVIQSAYEWLECRLAHASEKVQLARAERAIGRLAEQLDRLTGALLVYEQSQRIEFSPIPLAPLFRRRVHVTRGLVVSNPVLLDSILRNLVRNAVKYTRPGGRILIGCRRAGENVRIDVCDTGIGIASEHLSQIFEAFHRLDAAGADGLGIDLFVVRQAAELLGHGIEVRSRAGEGSRFSVLARAGE